MAGYLEQNTTLAQSPIGRGDPIQNSLIAFGQSSVNMNVELIPFWASDLRRSVFTLG